MNEPVRKPIDKYIPWFFVAFFTVLVLLISSFAWIAISTSPGVVTEDAYKKGLAYNAVIEKQKAQDALGWQSQLEVSGHAPAAIIFTLKDEGGRFIGGADVIAHFMRPTQAGHDQTVTLVSNGKAYKGSLTLPMIGLWEITVAAQKDGKNYQMSKRVTLP